MGADWTNEKKFSNPIPKEIFKANDGRKRRMVHEEYGSNVVLVNLLGSLEICKLPTWKKSRESSSSHTKSNSSSENEKSEGRNGSRQEEEKEDADNKKEEQSQDPSSDQPNPAPTTSQPVLESSISLPMQYGPRRTKAQARKSVLPIPPKSK
ncbi:hypothetical protein GH714_029105 [Hevea brasiliensis]|uniref:Uncharacterized protein n=1 Tax=Hevea brasiliensis TaxID=3981 RepID=A0A6A6LNX0_HEVBR|nr:hypothetical protein GH714_029105 [Hevea brasiliensis]